MTSDAIGYVTEGDYDYSAISPMNLTISTMIPTMKRWLSTIQTTMILGPNAYMGAAITLDWTLHAIHYFILGSFVMALFHVGVVFWFLGITIERGSEAQRLLLCARVVVLDQLKNEPSDPPPILVGKDKSDIVFGAFFVILGVCALSISPVVWWSVIGGYGYFLCGWVMVYSGTHEVAV